MLWRVLSRRHKTAACRRAYLMVTRQFPGTLSVVGTLHWVSFETMSLRQAVGWELRPLAASRAVKGRVPSLLVWLQGTPVVPEYPLNQLAVCHFRFLFPRYRLPRPLVLHPSSLVKQHCRRLAGRRGHLVVGTHPICSAVLKYSLLVVSRSFPVGAGWHHPVVVSRRVHMKVSRHYILPI